MIKSKPKTTALFSIAVFLILSFSLSFLNLTPIIKGLGKWYNYAIVVILLPLAIIILFRQLFKYKVITLQRDTFKVYYPFRLKVIKSKVKNLKSWEEITIKTKNGMFKQLEIHFPEGGKVSLSNQENSNYQDIFKYLARKADNIRIRS